MTGKQELYFAPWRRWLRYTLSAAVTAALLSCAFAVMLCSLNLQARPPARPPPCQWPAPDPPAPYVVLHLKLPLPYTITCMHHMQ